MKVLRFAASLFALTGLGILAPDPKARSIVGSTATTSSPADAAAPLDPAPPLFVYSRPTERMKIRTYVFDAFGPYPIVGAALIAAVNQREGTPPEWRQGAAAYGERFGSNLAIAAVTTTTRYALAEAFREDTVYLPLRMQRCFSSLGACSDFDSDGTPGPRWPSPLVFPGRRGTLRRHDDGCLCVVSGTLRPQRRLARMGNYNLLAFAGGNVALEFIYGGPHTLFSRLHRPALSGTDAGSTSNH